MDAEWERLRKMWTWDEVVVRKWADVAREARQAGKEVHLGYLLGLCFEKGSELPEGHPDRKFKGRSVFQGDRVVNQDWEVALFQDLRSKPPLKPHERAMHSGVTQHKSPMRLPHTSRRTLRGPHAGCICRPVLGQRIPQKGRSFKG